MRKYLFVAALAAISLTACQEEKDFNGKTLGENGVAFMFEGNAGTRSAEVQAPVQGAVLSVAKLDGVEIFLEESIVDLNADVAATRGTPVYTENLGYLFREQLSVRTTNYTGDVTYSQYDDAQDAHGGWRYGYTYPTDIWGGSKTTAVDFWFRLPSDMTSGNVVSGLTYNTGASTTFTYKSPATAVASKDIVFGGLSISYNDYYDAYAKYGGAKVTLYHALTGVKFAIANTTAELADIKITGISFKGLSNTGTCTFTPTADTKIAWSGVTATDDSEIHQDLGESDFITYTTTGQATSHFADSFFDGGTEQNLNDAKATKTFWLVPQAFSSTSAVKLKIEYTINGTAGAMVIDMKDLNALHPQDWQAGQIRTFTFKINDVNLKIEDDIDILGSADDGYKDSVKSGVKITNTGNTRAFIRAALVGQWLDSQNNPVFGFTDKVNKLYQVASWYEDQFVTKTGASGPARKQGEFVGLAGYDMANPNNGWTLCDDGYYYYTLAVEPDAVTTALFSSYKVGLIPNAEIAGAEIDNKSMHFTLEIATQAIAANDLNGVAKAWDDAWAEALGSKPVKKQ